MAPFKTKNQLKKELYAFIMAIQEAAWNSKLAIKRKLITRKKLEL